MRNILWAVPALAAALALAGAASAEPGTAKRGDAGGRAKGAATAFKGGGACAKGAGVGFRAVAAGECKGAKAVLASARGEDGGRGKAAFRGGKGKGGKGAGFLGGRGGKGKGEAGGFGAKGKGGKGPGAGDKGGKGPGGFGRGFGGGFGADFIVDRVLALDKNKDGKLTKDELPERMQTLIEKGDTNKDGALSKEEVTKLASSPQGLFQAFGRGGPGGFRGFGGGFPGGPRGRDGGRGEADAGALASLKLSEKTKEKAEAVVRAHEENVRRLMDLARSDLLAKMRDVLSEQDFKAFKESVERRPAPGPRAAPAAEGRSAELERRLDRLLKEVEELRREIKR
jgi:hypothetical protein